MFSTVANVDGATQFNETGSRLTLSESTLTLTDDTYQLAWLKSVNQLLGSQSNASLVMTGQLMNNDTVISEATVTDAATMRRSSRERRRRGGQKPGRCR